MPGLAVSTAHRAPGTPSPHGVQGITSNLDDLLLRGAPWKAQLGDALAEGKLTRTIRGASTLEIDVHDVKHRLLRSQLLQEEHDVSLDGMPFRMVKPRLDSLTAPLSLTYEPLPVVLLRHVFGPHKVFRDLQTRAEFNKRRVGEIDPVPRFVCPELHVEQPIEGYAEAKKEKAKRDEERKKGIGAERQVVLKVKGDAATKPQRELGEMALEIASSHNAPDRVMVALMEALIVESEMGASAPTNPLQATPASKSGSNAADIAAFLSGGWGTVTAGAIGYFKAHPQAPPGVIAQGVQGSAFPERYEDVHDEALAWVEAFGGSEISSLEFARYAFKQGEKESNWKVCNRLAGEVAWRFFESVGVIYYMTDRDLLDARVRFAFTDSTPGFVDANFDLDIGKDADEMKVTCYANAWAAPPGTVVDVGQFGPADGLWLVEKIEAPLARRNALTEIELTRPKEPKKEPAPKTKTTTFGSGGGSTPSKVQAMIDEIDKIDARHYPYESPGARGTPPPETGPYDCSGFVSRIAYVGSGAPKTTIASAELAASFEPGVGEYLTIFAKGPDGPSGHTFLRIKTPTGWRYAGTSSSNPGGGAGWIDDSAFSASYLAEFSKRHPKGL